MIRDEVCLSRGRMDVCREIGRLLLLLTVLVNSGRTAPLHQDVTPLADDTTPAHALSTPHRCTPAEFVARGGVCDIDEFQQIQDLCREIRREQARTYNREETGDEVSQGVACFGDIMLDKNQATDLLQTMRDGKRSGRGEASDENRESASGGDDEGGGEGERHRGGRVKRKIRSDFNTNKWPTNIYYRIDKNLGGRGMSAVRDGIALWEAVTCLNFTEVFDEDFERQHLVFLDGGMYFGGCSSYIGRVTSMTAQPIYLSPSCRFEAVVAHEIAHALGFIHEHQRPDRDSYVTIHASHIRRGYEGYFAAFRPTVVDSLGIDYDYASVMHYYGTAFSALSNTIETKDPRFQRTIGQRVEISFLDTQLLNRAYCADTCAGVSPLNCEHHGYQDPHDCSRCRCPDGWQGTLCQNIAVGKKAECGGILMATNEVQSIESPGYSSDKQLYELGQECTWIIKVHRGGHIKLEFEGEFRLLDDLNTCYHWVEIRTDMEAGKLTNSGPRYCGSSRPTEVITSTGSEVMVLFRARFMLQARSEMRGFRLLYSSDENACSNAPCQNGGVCESTETGFHCDCQHNFQGETCQLYNFNFSVASDLVFLLDTTYHSYKDFYSFKTVTQRLLSYIHNPSVSLLRALVTFDSSLRQQLDFTEDITPLIDSVGSLYTNYGGTDIFSVFHVLFNKYYTSVGPDRPNVSNVAVMILDSRHTYWSSHGMIESVQSKLRENCVEVIVVSIRSKVDRGLLDTLVGRSNTLHVTGYELLLEPATLDTVIGKVKTAIEKSKHCIESQTTTSSTASTVAPSSSISSTTVSRAPSSTVSSTTVTMAPSSSVSSTTASTSPSSSTASTTVQTTVHTTTTTSTVATTRPTTTTSTEASTVQTTATSSSTREPTTSATVTTTGMTTTMQSTSTTTQGSGCMTERGSCDEQCGGCGYMDVKQHCYVNGVKQLVDEYREPCNTSPCEKDCSVWIGKYYPRMCKMCCAGYIVRGEVCIQDDRER